MSGRLRFRAGARVRAVVEDGDFEQLGAGCYVGDLIERTDEDGYWTVELEEGRRRVVTVCLHESEMEVI